MLTTENIGNLIEPNHARPTIYREDRHLDEIR